MEPRKRTFTCGLDAAIAVVGGKWKGLILFALQDGPLRFGELRRTVNGISERVLIAQLREMETTGLLGREVYHEVPPRVEYSLTAFGHSLNHAMASLGEWGEKNIETIETLPWDEVTNRSGRTATGRTNRHGALGTR